MKRILFKLALVSAFIGSVLVAPVIGQAVVRIYGTVSDGTFLPILVDSTGRVIVDLSGGDISPDTITTDSVTFDIANSDVVLSRGAANKLLLASGDSLAFGGVTASFPLLRNSGARLEIVLGDGSAFADVDVASVTGSVAGVNASGAGSAYFLGSIKFAINTAPTVANACTGEAMVWNNGTAAFEADMGTTCAGVSTVVFTLPTATNAWSCTAMNVTTSATAAMEMTASNATTATFTNYTRTTGVALQFVDGANVRVSCLGG